MSTPQPKSNEGFDVIQENDAVASRKVSLVLLITIVVAIASAAGAAVFLGERRAGLAFHEAPSATVASRQIANIHQTLMVRDRHGLDLREEQRRALDEYRFIDREHGVAEIPIDRAMRIVVDEADSGPSP